MSRSSPKHVSHLADTSTVKDGDCDKCDATDLRVLEIYHHGNSLSMCWPCLSDALALVLGLDNEFPDIEIQVLAWAEWQPIDTAPKDGTRIFAYCVEWEEPVVLRWLQRWHSMSGTWGWCDNSGDMEQDYVPTHWMPIPEPPK